MWGGRAATTTIGGTLRGMLLLGQCEPGLAPYDVRLLNG